VLVKFFIKVFFSILLIFNLTFVSSAKAGPTFVNADTFDVGTRTVNKPQNVVFSADGLRMFVLNNMHSPSSNDGDRVDQYHLSTKFDITSAGTIQAFKIVKNEDSAPRGIAFSASGFSMFVVGDDGNEVNEYTLQTAFDLSSNVSLENTFSISQDSNPAGIAFNDNGTRMFVVGFNDGEVNTYSLATGFDLSNGSGTEVRHINVFSTIGQDSHPNGIAFNNDGTMMFLIGPGNANVNKYTLESPFDLSNGSGTAVTSVGSFDLSNQSRGLAFNEDGTVMYVTATVESDILSYDLDAPFDIGFTDPILSSSVPADNATSVAVDANIVLNFSENVDAESGDIEIYKTTGGVLVETISVTSSQVTGTGSTQITVNPSSNFDDLTEYYVLISADAFDDVDGRSYAGISSATVLSFTSVNTIPTLTSSVILNA
jgi:sugar lactone lactonase YvrE